MAGLRELKRHLKSIDTVGHVAGAMRSASSAKYAKLNRITREYRVYAESCEDAYALFPETEEAANPDAPELCLLIASNRGLSGGYNNELFAFAETLPPANRVWIAVGKKAIAYCREKQIETAGEYVFPDIPKIGDVRPLFDALYGGYRNGTYSSVKLIYPKFRNAAVQIPQELRFLPPERKENGGGDVQTLILPDSEETRERIEEMTLCAGFFGHILEAALGAQAAMMMAMRAAYDNAVESGDALRIAISRERQRVITASVIETASGNRKEDNA